MDNESTATSATVSANTRVERRSGVVSCNLSDEAVLLDMSSGIYFGLNPVGASIWRLIERPRTPNQIREELQKEYEIDTASCEAAVQQFLGLLAAKGLITLLEQ